VQAFGSPQDDSGDRRRRHPARLVRSLLPAMAVVVLVGLLLHELVAHGLARAGLPPLWARTGATALTLALVLGAFHVLVTRRLRRLNRALRGVASGDLEPILRSRGEDEIGRLTGSLDDMVTTLRRNFEELRTNEELRRRLVANVSHELRTPLTSIQGYLETARLAEAGSQELSANLEICHREARRLARLVQDLFQLSKLDAHQLEFQFETLSLVEVADQVGLAFEQRMEDKEISFATDYPDDPLEVVADGNRVAQVVQNLLGNAIVFTPPGGRVTLSCSRDGDHAVCRVSDTGIGIGEKDLPHIFDSFFHLEKSRTRNLGGTGLGLAICKAIIDAHGGSMDVESRVGEGTTFSFRLKIAPDYD
jgi:signal transduction histidine kinase